MKNFRTKNLLPTALVFAFGLLLFVPVNFVHAEEESALDMTGVGGNALQNQAVADQVNAAVVNAFAPNSAAAKTATAAAANSLQQTQDAVVPPGNSEDCNIGNIGACAVAALAIVAFGMFSFAGFLLSIVGIILNWVIQYTVFQFGSYFGNSSGLLIGWGILRDIGNIVLLFSFIFLGIMMVLNLDNVGTRQTIPKLLIIALLLNFSLFITEAVIDVSNVLSSALYNQASANCSASGANCIVTSSNAQTFVNNGIAGQILQAGGLSTVFTQTQSGTTSGVPDLGKQPIHKLIFYIMMTIFVSVTMVVLLAAAVLLLIRGVVLVFIMVTSPLGFVATIVPRLESIASTWRKLLISESFFAPVLLLLILVSLKILKALSSAINPSSATLVDAVSSQNGNIGVTSIILLFTLVIGFMIASLMSAKQLGAVGATAVTNAATKAVRSTVTAPLRLGAYGAGVGFRTGVGAVAPRLASGYNNMIGAARARGGVSGGVAKVFDRVAGGAITGGLQKVQDTSVGGAKSYTDRKKEIDARDKVTGKIGKVTLAMDAITNATGPQRNGESNADYQKRIDAGKKAVRDMSQDTLEAAVEKKGISHEDLAFIASNVATAKARKLMESEHVKDAEKKEFIKLRMANINKLRTDHEADVNNPNKTPAERHASFAALKTEAEKLSNEERTLMSIYAKDEYSALSDLRNTYDPANHPGSYGDSVWKESQIDADLANKEVEDSEKLKLRAAKKIEQLNDVHTKLAAARVSGNVAQIAAQIDELQKLAASTDDLGKAKNQTILEVSANAPIRKKHLQSIVAEGKMTSATQIDELFDNIQNNYLNNINTPGYDNSEYEHMKNFIATNAAAKAMFGGRALA